MTYIEVIQLPGWFRLLGAMVIFLYVLCLFNKEVGFYQDNKGEREK